MSTASTTETTAHPSGANPEAADDRSFYVIALAARILLLVAVLSGLKQFEVWDSVRQFIGYDPWVYLNTPFQELSSNAWWIRTGIVLPSLIASEWTSLDRDLTFGIYATLAVILTIRMTNQTQDEWLGPSAIRTLGTTLLLVSVSLFMNGRICFAILGAAWIYRSHFRWFRGDATTLSMAISSFGALVLMTVSTGSFYVGVSIVMTSTVLGLRDPRPGPAQGQWTLNSLLAAIPSILLIAHQASLFNEKLARWHDGNYLMIVYHGPLLLVEEVVPSIPPELILCGLFVGGACGLMFWLGYANMYPVTDTQLATTVAMGILCGAFGWSTLATNLPGYILMGWSVLAAREPIEAGSHRGTAAV